jgi:hypothetical protein
VPYTSCTRKTCVFVALFFAAAVLADAPPAHYKSVVVAFTVGNDGALHVAEQADIDVPPGGGVIERTYWSDDEQKVRFERVIGPDGAPVSFEEGKRPSTIAWHGGSGRYVIESTIDNAVIPIWGIPRAETLTREESRMIVDPRTRLKAILPIWRQGVGHWRSRYLLDFQYEMPPVSDEGTDIQLQLFWPSGWETVRTITGDTIARKIPYDTYNSTRWRVMHLFDTDAPVDVRKDAIRMAAIAGFPIVCLLLWILFAIREVWRHGVAPGEEVDERVLRETLYNEPPEVIAARWSGVAKRPRIETFLRRLEQQRKVALVIEEKDVSLRLIAPRDQLTPYERAGIDPLIPEGWEVTSEQIQARHAEEGFDPTNGPYAVLTQIAAESNGPPKSPWYSRLTSFAIFASGIYTLIFNLKESPSQPLLIFAALVGSSMATAFWPDATTRILLRSTIWAVFLPLIAIVIATAIVFAINLAPQSPLSVYGAGGLALVMVAVCKAGLAASATRESRAAMQRRAELVRVRRFLRREVRSEHPRLRDDIGPYLAALGLPVRGFERTAQDENWGGSLFA